MFYLSNAQARRFLLRHQGLLGEHRFQGKAGALAYVRQAGCIQFDPVDVCGRNAELTLQSRVKGFTKETLWELLYQDRLLVDCRYEPYTRNGIDKDGTPITTETEQMYLGLISIDDFLNGVPNYTEVCKGPY